MALDETKLPEHAKFGDKAIEATVEGWFVNGSLQGRRVAVRGHWGVLAPVLADAAALNAYWIGRSDERARVLSPWVSNHMMRALSSWGTGQSKMRFPFHLGRLVTVIHDAIALALKNEPVEPDGQAEG